ncbi:Decarboxylase orsB [Colletotrichum siamense]|uniref:Decarboxylase orsB n=1 Tax=Colletotrichum siamense TaxID=690259 RepID=A0A9P5K2A0_COLSI|nr:Decarboxylase orsB [Colletotrichum siamense]KAF4853938.1 Decarboxylase orsB [Colletotrichum siamense]
MALNNQAITLEEHVIFPSFGDDYPFYKNIWEIYPDQQARAWDLGSLRLSDMKAGGIAFQILSHLPGVATNRPDLCRRANDEMAKAIRQTPDRFAGFAALPMGFPDDAVTELRRAVNDLGFVGAMVDNHLEDMTHYDNSRFWPIFGAAEELGVPIYLHPSPPTPEVFKSRYRGNYSTMAEIGLGTASWGWHEDVGLHILKVYLAGVFERFPKMKIIIGHMGELLPMMLSRVESMPAFQAMADKGSKSIKDVWHDNIWVTTSGIFCVDTFKMLRQVTRIEHILFSVDYPFESSSSGRTFLTELLTTNTLTEEEVDMISRKNAIHLLGLSESAGIDQQDETY